MIKILFYIDTLEAGGAEKVLRTLVNHMDQEKFAVTVMTAFPEDAKKYLVPGITYRSLYKRNDRLNALRFRLEAALGLSYRLHIKGGYDIEVAYLECGPTKVMAGSTNKKALKLAWVHCDLAKKAEDIGAFVKKTKPWYETFHKIVCVSENVRESFHRLYGTQFDTEVLYNVNDEDEISAKAALTVPQEERKNLVAVGRLTPQKGFDRLIEAAALLKKDTLSFRLQILGEGEERPMLEARIKDYGLEEQVELLGFQSNPYPYMAGADVIVCSSRYEGLSTAVTEALILGKAVVTTPCTGMDELLGDSEYGLITEDSVQGLYAGIRRMLTEPETRAAYEKAAAGRGRDFSKEKILARTEEFFAASLEAVR